MSNQNTIDYQAIAQMLSGATAPRRDRYFTPGAHLVSITNIRFIETREDGHKCAIIESSIIDSTDETLFAGTDVSYFINLNKGPRDPKGATPGVRDLRLFLETMFSETGNNIEDAKLMQMIMPDANTGVSPLSGKQAIVTVVPKTTRTGGTFNVHTFKLFDEATMKRPDFAAIKAAATITQPAPQAPVASPTPVDPWAGAQPATIAQPPMMAAPTAQAQPTQQWMGNMPSSGQIPF